MKKMIRGGALAFFAIAFFAVVTALIRLRQDYVGDLEAPLIGGLLDKPEDDPSASESDAGDGGAAEPDPVLLEQGRSLFENPTPLSAEEISGLMDHLNQRSKQLDEREAALNQEELLMRNMMEDLEANRKNLMDLAEEVEAQVTPESGTSSVASTALEEENIKRVAMLIEKMEPAQAAQVLQAKPPEQSAAVLMKIENKKVVAEILETFTEENLSAVTDAILYQESQPSGRG